MERSKNMENEDTIMMLKGEIKRLGDEVKGVKGEFEEFKRNWKNR